MQTNPILETYSLQQTILMDPIAAYHVMPDIVYSDILDTGICHTDPEHV